ncbi:hypothetical protein DVH24_037190 [Malus domestica]|uniref:Gibberellin-regulated protein 14 n=2 Tax=Malus domestica TaxID=3750 RepID=A0A498HD69_MALDO|nr:hypothetical protein DVH24_037190 [Malus domestica]
MSDPLRTGGKNGPIAWSGGLCPLNSSIDLVFLLPLQLTSPTFQNYLYHLPASRKIITIAVVSTFFSALDLSSCLTMASKTVLLLFATVLLFTARASSLDDHEELAIKSTYGNAPAPQPLVKAPSPPLAKPPCPPLAKPPSPLYTKPPSPVSPPVKPPTPVSPPVMPPTYPPLPPVRSKSDCVPLCEKRCMQHSRKRPCMRACTACCDRCRCVPPGTFGNEEKCGQ